MQFRWLCLESVNARKSYENKKRCEELENSRISFHCPVSWDCIRVVTRIRRAQIIHSKTSVNASKKTLHVTLYTTNYDAFDGIRFAHTVTRNAI